MKCNAMEPGEFKADLLPFLCSRGGLLKRIGRAQVSFKVAGHTRGRAKTQTRFFGAKKVEINFLSCIRTIIRAVALYFHNCYYYRY